MVRNLGLVLLLIVSSYGCTEDPIFNVFDVDSVYNEIIVDFSVEIVDNELGKVRIIDRCSGVEKLNWRCFIDSEEIFISDTYPGDTIYLTLDMAGTYVVELTGNAKAVQLGEDGNEETVYLQKTKVKSFEIEGLAQVDLFQPYLKYVIINSFPALDKYAFPWDADGSGPDVLINTFYVYDDEFINEPLTGELYMNLSSEQLPIIETVDFDFSILGVSLNIEMVDIDTRRENRFLTERMALEEFHLEWTDSPLEPGLTEYTFNHFTIGVEWK